MAKTKLTLKNGDTVFLELNILEAKYIIDSALNNRRGLEIAFKDEQLSQSVLVNLKMVVMIEEV